MDGFCSSDGRSWTDLVTNQVSLDGLPETDVETLIDWKNAPTALLPAFVHELQHNSTFNSPVGKALALLNFSARTKSFGDELFGSALPKMKSEALLEFAHFEVASRLLRPLIEGIALFAEFDIMQRGTNEFGDLHFHSRTMISTVHFFARTMPLEIPPYHSVAEGVSSYYELVRTTLDRARRKPALISRKCEVFGMPLGYQGDGYLLGYLAVKALYRMTQASARYFEGESDAFLGYLTDFIFQDYALVDLILDSAANESDFARSISDYLAGRLWHVGHKLRPETVSMWAVPIIGEDGRPCHKLDAETFHVDAFEWRRGEQKLTELQERILALRHNDRLLGAEELLWNVASRDLVVLDPAPVEIEVFSTRIDLLRKDGSVIDSLDVPASLKNGRYKAHIKVVFASNSKVHGRVCLLLVDGAVVTGWLLTLPEYAQELEQICVNSLQLDPSVSKRFIAFEADTKAWARDVTQSLMTAQDRLTDAWFDIYGSFALFPLYGKRLRGELQKMTHFGLLPILDGEDSLVQSLALLGLSQSVSEHEFADPLWLVECGLPAGATIRKLRELLEPLGLRPFEQRGELLKVWW